MKEMTIAITTAFWRHEKTSDFTFLWNIDDYDGSDPNANQEDLYGAWMKENYNCQLRKQQFTIAIGYMCPNEMDQDREQRDNFFGNSGRWGGNPEFIRGEFNDGKWGKTPVALLNRPLHYYWTAISSVDKGDGSLKTACTVYNEAGKNWLTKEVIIGDALLDNGGPKGADLIIQNTGNTNCRFHLIELERSMISLDEAKK
jgi:hypothetical protein